MASNQGQVSASTTVYFRSRGGVYTATFTASTGDLFQRYTDDNQYYPDFTKNPAQLNVAVTSSRTMQTIVPDSIKYYISGTELTFDNSGNGTNVMAKYFRKVNNQLIVIGNLAEIFGGASFTITAEIYITAGDSADKTYAYLPVSIAKYVNGDSAIVTITDISGHNCQIQNPTDVIQLACNIWNPDQVLDADKNSKYKFRWYQLGPTGWEPKTADFQTGPNAWKLNVKETDVGRWAEIRVDVQTLDGTSVGTDTQIVEDATDPYEINYELKVRSTATGAFTSTNDPTINEDWDDNAALQYTTSVVRRDGSAVTGTVTWNKAAIVTAAGLEKEYIQQQSQNVFTLTKKQLSGLGGTGQYMIIFSATIS